MGEKPPRVAEGIPGGVAEGWFRMDPRQWPTWTVLVLMPRRHPCVPLRGGRPEGGALTLDRH